MLTQVILVNVQSVVIAYCEGKKRKISLLLKE